MPAALRLTLAVPAVAYRRRHVVFLLDFDPVSDLGAEAAFMKNDHCSSAFPAGRAGSVCLALMSRTSLVCQHARALFWVAIHTAVACSSNPLRGSASSLVSAVKVALFHTSSLIVPSSYFPLFFSCSVLTEQPSLTMLECMCTASRVLRALAQETAASSLAGRRSRLATRSFRTFRPWDNQILPSALASRSQAARARSLAEPPSYGGEHRLPAFASRRKSLPDAKLCSHGPWQRNLGNNRYTWTRLMDFQAATATAPSLHRSHLFDRDAHTPLACVVRLEASAASLHCASYSITLLQALSPSTHNTKHALHPHHSRCHCLRRLRCVPSSPREL